eukprot:scpid20772/ scgid34152/ Heterogeneous nuclear ribonucleoprotein H2; FTP-3; Heterogeneous nuclear ribonucleoprotein H&apos; Heterogeneous nuclear ribonucleoprotein H2; Heterogeneous nuclear ribonucleoprotein H&apos
MSGFSYWLRLRGLPFNSAPIDICRFLKDVRLEGGVDGVYFGMNQQGKPSGEAFVEVLTEEEVEKALLHHKALIGNRYIEVYASSEDEMWRKTERGRKPGHFVRLRGLPFGCLKEDIKMFFEGCYIRPRGITLLLDKQERCSGGAYVEFATKKGFDLALQRHRNTMGERYVEVFSASEVELNQLIEKSRDGVRGFSVMVGSGGGGGGGGPPSGPGAGRGRGGRPRDMGMRERESREPMFHGRDDRHMYPGFEQGRRAMAERGRGMRMGGEELRIPRQTIPIREADIHGPEPLHVPVVSPAPEHRVHVRGMPPSANASDLTKLFYPIAVMNVLLINDPQGRPTGEADVFFNSHTEAIKALDVKRQMGNFRLDFYLHSEPGAAERTHDSGSVSHSLHSGGSGGGGGGSHGMHVHSGFQSQASGFDSLSASVGFAGDVDHRARAGSRGAGAGYGHGAGGGQYQPGRASYGRGQAFSRDDGAGRMPLRGAGYAFEGRHF